MIQRLRHREYTLLIVLLVVVTLLALPTLTYPLGRDQGEFATIARGILNGRIPYKDLWNPKPPAVFYVYALAMQLFGQTTVAIRLIDFMIFPFISAALYWLGRQLSNRRVGLWAALIFPVFYFSETFWTLTQNDGIVLLPMTLAMVCVFKVGSRQPAVNSREEEADSRQSTVGSQQSVVERQETEKQIREESQKTEAARRDLGQRSLIYAGLAGALAAYTFWFKYPFALVAVLVVVSYLLLNGRVVQWKRVVGWLVAFGVGFGLILGGGALYLMSIGAWDELVLSARVTSQYTALTFNPQDLIPLMGGALWYRWQQWGLLVILVAGWVLAGRGKCSRGWWVTVLWALAGLVMMLVQAKGYDYHWLPMLPPVALLAADSLDRLLKRLATLCVPLYPSLCALAGGLLLAVLIVSIWTRAWPYLSGQEDQTTYFSHFVAGEFVADESLKVSNFLRAREAEGDSLYIWGFRPEVYYMSGLNPATRFIFQFPLVANWYPLEWKKENVDILWAALPPYVLVLQVDYMPWVTGSHEDSNTLLQEYTELNNWLVFNYERETQIGNFFIWRRKPSPGS